MPTLWEEIVKGWLEFWGRKKYAETIPFPENEVIVRGERFRVSLLTQAKYINLHPTLYAVAVSSDGTVYNLKGGYNTGLKPGRYILNYVDKRDRQAMVPKISETTRDGAVISLELIISYRVTDPIKAVELERPLEKFISPIQPDIKEFIRIHQHDEIIASNAGQSIASNQIVNYLLQQHNRRHHVSRVFTIIDIMVEGKEGDPKITEIRKNFQVQQKKNVAETELLKQNQDLEKKVAAQDAELRRIKAQAEVDQQQILQKMRRQEIELENERNTFQWQQAKWSRAMDAIAQTLTTPNYQRDQRELELIHELLEELKSLTAPPSDSKPVAQQSNLNEPASKKSGDKIDALTNALLSLLEHKKK